MGRWAMPMKHPITESIPVTHAVSTVIRCGCGSVDRVDVKDLLENGYECTCGRAIPARGDLLKLHGKRAMNRGRRKP